jgi:signal transduction histidine kinase
MNKRCTVKESSDLYQVQSQNYFANTMPDPQESNQLVSQIINLSRTNSDSQKLLSEISGLLAVFLKADSCLILAGIERKETIQAAFCHGGQSSAIPAETIDYLLSHPQVEDILATEEPLQFYLLEENQGEVSAKGLETMVDCLGVATTFQGRVNGMILLGYSQEHEWTSQEKALLKMAAEPVSLACFQAQIKKEIEENSEVRKFSFPPSLSNLSRNLSLDSNPLFKRWYQLTHQQLEQQRQLNQLKNEIITAISDQARNPLATMKVAMEMLSNGKQLSPQLEQKYWEILKQEWRSLNELITNIVTLKQLESQELSFNPQFFDVQALIRELVEPLQKQWLGDKRRRLSLVFNSVQTDSVSLYSDPQHLRTILVELLNNAGTYSSPETTVYFNLFQSVTEEDSSLVITLTNLGCPIFPDEQEEIFEPLRRGQKALDKSIVGTGLGLALVKGLVYLLNGTIEVTSHPTDNPDLYETCFTVTLPQ